MTLEQLQARLDQYLAAETKILKAQDYVIGQGATARRLTRADLAEVRQAITDIRADIARLQCAQGNTRRVAYIRPF